MLLGYLTLATYRIPLYTMSTEGFFHRIIVVMLITCLFTDLHAQVELTSVEACYDNIIGEIGALEADKDPKCHATANRLEDFMFGTPLSFEAREYRTNLHQELAYTIWLRASQFSGDGQTITVKNINQAADQVIKFVVSNGKHYLGTNDNKYIEINKNDLRQYGTIAYSLRAVLAVQQKALFGNDELLVLDKDAVNKLKHVLDMTMLTILKVADLYARDANEYELSKAHLKIAEQMVIHDKSENHSRINVKDVKLNHDYSMTKKTINQKLASYKKYNDLNQTVFLRNVQVYFAKVLWPETEKEEKELVRSFQDATIQYTMEMLHFSEKLARADSVTNISLKHMHRTVTSFLPFEVNEFEDVIYFPLLPKKERIVIESYDLDAFRDSGIHWKILDYVLADPAFKGTLEPDPYALELLVEATAQFGVLLWRIGGHETKSNGSDRLNERYLLEAMETIKNKIKKNNSMYARDLPKASIASSEDVSNGLNNNYFKDVTKQAGISFTHRSADWLNRQLRSFVIKKDTSGYVARLSVPPAFGGSGVAAEDINGDGYDDILLLSGSGNKLYLNNGDKSFNDITKTSGLSNYREDGTHAEPRQPIIADFNNDGYQDIFISYVDDVHQLYQGDGSGRFKQVTFDARLGGEELVGGPCTAADFNNDGLLDLYIGYFGNYVKGELPTLSRNNTNGSPNQLFRNDGNFQFTNVTEGSGVDDNGWTQAVGHTDINNDGWQDLIAGNDFGNNAYLINQKNGTFIDKSEDFDTDKSSYTMNVGIGDLNRDRIPDFYISNIVVMEKDDKYVLPSEDTKMHFDPNSLSTMRVVEANDLFLSRSSNQEISYENSELIERGLAETGWSWDADFFDYDNDGDDDLYCLNGMNPYSVYGTDNQYYQSPDGDAPNVQFAESQSEHNVFFKNEGGKLIQASKESGVDLYHTSRSAAYTDYDNDGDLDIILSNYHGDAYFYENKSEQLSNNYLKVRLTDLDKGQNRDAIGARIIAHVGTNKGMWREVHSTDGYLSGHPKTIHFGLGQNKEAQIEIRWPDGQKDKLSLLGGGATYHIYRENGEVKVRR